MKLFKYINIKYEIRDLWVGIFWDIDKISTCPCGYDECCHDDSYYKLLKIYVCLIPCFPIIIKKRIQ